MAISVGTRFGAYEVAALIGVGGMGEVYRATDPSLKRSVALKVLSESFVGDANRLARLQREAEMLAALNHGNVAHIYGLERSEGTTALVMEFIEGPTLAERIAQGRVPVEEALRIANQIADALEAAHERGIVHRDLKPANIKLRPDGTVKVLDFGVAKALDARTATQGQAALTTPAMTEAGMLLGTAAYMSPEQARGKPVDRRTDIWAFGCVLYEMLTGQPAFLGEDVTTTLARVLQADADLNALPSEVSASVRRTLQLCFEKDARKRIADISDVKLALAGAFMIGAPVSAPKQPLWRRAVPTGAAAALLALVVGVVAWSLKPAPAPQPKIITRFNYELPDGVTLGSSNTSVLDIASSGELFVVHGSNGIYVRRMGDAEARVIPGTEGTVCCIAVSPTGREVAFVRTNPAPQLVKVAVDGGGAPIVLGSGIGALLGSRWEPDGTLFFGQGDGIWRVSDSGGTPPQRVIESKSGESLYGAQLLPGGEWLLFTVANGTRVDRLNNADIVVQSLVSGERRVLRSGGFDARYLPSGYITYVSSNVLFASAFDVKSLKLDSERVPLVPGVQTAGAGPGGSGFYAVANNGTLVFIPGAKRQTTPQRSLVWVDREGRESPLPLRPDDYTTARISPDGAKAVLIVGFPLPVSQPPPRLFLYDFKTENLAQLTFPPDDGWDYDPVWSRDGSRIFYRSYRANGSGVFAIPAEGGTPQFIGQTDPPSLPLPWSTSPDGKTLLVVYGFSPGDFNLGTLEIGNSDKITPLLHLEDNADEPSLSPNGQWLVECEFPKSELARGEVNIRPFPGVTQQRRPVGSGRHPVFSADGSELFVFDGTGLSAALIQYAPLRIGSLRKLFRGAYFYGRYRTWDMDPTTGRFLMITMPKEEAERPQIHVVLNWVEELKQRVRPSEH